MGKTIFAFIVWLLLLVAAVNADNTKRRIVCFYNPAANVESFAALKISLDAYLTQAGPYEWQPFNDPQALAAFLLSHSSSLVVLPSWLYAQLNQRIALKPLLVGVNKSGHSFQPIVLVGKQVVSKPDTLRGSVIAVAGSEAFAHQLLAKLFPSQPLGRSMTGAASAFQILTVPKDIDALLAVGFGMAQFALASEQALTGLAAINPNLAKALVVSEKSHGLLLPIVATTQAASRDNVSLVAVIENMGATAQGMQKLRMIGVDGWKRLELLEVKRLQDWTP